MKKIVYAVMLLFGLSVMNSCEKAPEDIKVTSVTLTTTSLSLVEGESETIEAVVSPSNATNTKVIWSTSNSTIATVREGKITAKKEGNATITATTDDGGKTATCQVEVKAKTISVTGVSLSDTELTLTEGDKSTLTVTVSPDNATDKTVTWSSDNTGVATVNSTTGEVTAVKAGTAHITATTKDGGKTATCTVTVSERTYPVTGVSLNKTSTTITIGGSETLIPTITPSNATNKAVSWSSDNTTVADVDQVGKVTAKAVGSSNIMVTTSDGGYTATCVVTVDPIHVTGVTVTPTTLTLTEGDKSALTATVSPDNATDKTVTWSSDNTGVATVNSTTGEVTAVKAGTAHITATTKDGGKTATCTVTVSERTYPVTGVSLNKTSTTITIGGNETLIPTITPSNATNKAVSWSSDNTTVADVDQAGKVTAKAVGSANIKVTTTDGGFTATCTVTVSPIPVTSVTLDRTSASLKVGESITLTPTVKPDNATDKTVSWTTSDAAIATVSNGVVTAKKVGAVTITAKAGDKTATCTITVEGMSEGITPGGGGDDFNWGN